MLLFLNLSFHLHPIPDHQKMHNIADLIKLDFFTGKKLFFSALLFIIFFADFVHADYNSLKLIPLPAAEVEIIITTWLDSSGFDITRKLTRTGTVELTGTRVKEKWSIVVKHHSPFATEIETDFIINGASDIARREVLWNHISNYMKSPGRKKSLPDRGKRDQTIPVPVLGRIGSVVCIKGGEINRNVQLSGFFVNRNGLIICTAHDLALFEDIAVVIYDGSVVKGKVVKIDHKLDLAFVYVKFKSYDFIFLKNGRNLLGMGERIYSIGCPNNLGGTIYTGIINGPPRNIKGIPYWQADMEIYPGSSGSPVFDVQGNLVAIIKGRYKGTDTLGFLIPFETIIEFVNK